MNDISSIERLATLSVEQRNALESLLMDFDRSWTPASLSEYAGQLESESDSRLRELAATELVKIDLQRGWSSGQGRLLEEYLQQLPALGTADSISPELILAEHTARQDAESTVELVEYAARFPRQYERVVQLVNRVSGRQGAEPSKIRPGQTSVDTSRVSDLRDTKSNERLESVVLPAEFGRYRILRELGSGAMGKVYLAHDVQLDRKVALKTPTFEHGKDEELITRFYREARSAAKIQHRNICPIYDVGEIDGRHFISMAFIKGRPMSELIDPSKPPAERTAAVIVHRLSRAMAEAHRHNVVHRDLKPANIMIDHKREPVIMDFGLARQTDTDSRVTQSGMIIGTPAYMSPEQLSGNPDDIGKHSDIYSLGVILYELLTGELPFNGSFAQVVAHILSAEPRPPSEIRAGVSSELQAICLKMMAKDPNARYRSMDEVDQALKEFLSGSLRQEPSQAKSPADDSASGEQPAARPRALHEEADAEPISETAVLNDFFAVQSTNASWQTSVESEPARHPSLVKPHRRHFLRRGWFSGSRKRIAAGLAGTLLVAAVLGIVFVVQTPYGTLRVEAFDDLDGLEVLVDGNKVRLANSLRAKAVEHELQLKLDGAKLKLDPANSQFVLSNQGAKRRLVVTVGNVRLSSNEFTVVRNEETVLQIRLLPDAKPPNSAATPHALSLAGQATADSATSDNGAKPGMTQSRNAGTHDRRLRSDAKVAVVAPADVSAGPAAAAKRLDDRTDVPTGGSPAGGSRHAVTISANADMRQMTLAPDERSFAATGIDTPGEITIWDAVTGKRLKRFRVSEGAISNLSYSKDGGFLLFSSGKSVNVVDSASGKLFRKLDCPSFAHIATFPSHNWVACLFFERAASKQEVKSNAVPRRISIWDWQSNTKRFEQTVKAIGNQAAYYPAVSPDERFLTLGMRHNHVRYDIVIQGESVTLVHPTAMERTSLVRGPLVFSKDGRWAATPRKNRDSLFAILNIQTGRLLRELDAERASKQGMGSRMAFMADGRRIVVTDHGGGVSLWNCDTGALIDRLYSHREEEVKHEPPGILVTQDNRIITSGGPHDRRIIISQLSQLP